MIQKSNTQYIYFWNLFQVTGHLQTNKINTELNSIPKAQFHFLAKAGDSSYQASPCSLYPSILGPHPCLPQMRDSFIIVELKLFLSWRFEDKTPK